MNLNKMPSPTDNLVSRVSHLFFPDRQRRVGRKETLETRLPLRYLITFYLAIEAVRIPKQSLL